MHINELFSFKPTVLMCDILTFEDVQTLSL